MSNRPVRFVDDIIPLTEEEKENEVDFASIALNKILDSIRIGDKKELRGYLETIAIEQLSAKDQLILVDAMLLQAYQVDDRDIPDFIFGYFDDRMGGITRLKTLCLYLMRGGLEEYILSFIASSITHTSFEAFIHDLNTGETSPEVYEACINAEKVFGKMDKETLEKLKLYLCIDPVAKNYYIDKYVSEKLGNKQVITAPEWIVNYTGEIADQSDLFVPSYPNIKLRSPENYAKEFISQRKTEYKDDKGVQRRLDNDFTYALAASTYAIMPLEEKVTMINELIKKSGGKRARVSEESLRTDIIHFLTYGPNNIAHDLTVKRYDENLPCLKSGGCRMFLCVCCEDDEEDMENPEEKSNWFKGRCDICSRLIQRKHYAIRRPLPLGGWKGCFCSFDCLNNDVKDPQDLISPSLISILTELLFKIGIQERTYKSKSQTIL